MEEFDLFDADDVITILDNEGKHIECLIVAVLEHQGQEFALLARAANVLDEDDDTTVEMFIFHYGFDEDDQTVLSAVEDDYLYEAVRKEFEVLLEEEA